MSHATTSETFPRLTSLIARSRRRWLDDAADVAAGALVIGGLLAALLALG